MTQEAIVIRTLPNQMAEVLVKRPTACGGSCGSCESCIYQSELRAFARNLINAVPGQKVTISTESGRVYSAALLVYIVPLLFFVLGFAIPAALLLIRSQKRKTAENPIRFDIIS